MTAHVLDDVFSTDQGSMSDDRWEEYVDRRTLNTCNDFQEFDQDYDVHVSDRLCAAFQGAY